MANGEFTHVPIGEADSPGVPNVDCIQTEIPFEVHGDFLGEILVDEKLHHATLGTHGSSRRFSQMKCQRSMHIFDREIRIIIDDFRFGDAAPEEIDNHIHRDSRAPDNRLP